MSGRARADWFTMNGMEANGMETNGSGTMRAISQDVLGGPEVLREVELERPVPRANEVLVRVRAAGLNPTDWKHRAGGLFLGQPPFVLGWDVSGVVEATGVGASSSGPETRSSACSRTRSATARTPST